MCKDLHWYGICVRGFKGIFGLEKAQSFAQRELDHIVAAGKADAISVRTHLASQSGQMLLAMGPHFLPTRG